MKKLFLFLFTALFINSVFASMSETEEESTEEVSSESVNTIIEKIEQLNLRAGIKEEKSHQDFRKEKRNGFGRQNAFLVEDPERYPVTSDNKMKDENFTDNFISLLSQKEENKNEKIIFETVNEQTEEELNEMLNDLHFDKENNPNSQNIIWESKGDFFNESEEEDDLPLNNNEITKKEIFIFQGYFSPENKSKLFSPRLKENKKRDIKKKKKR